MQLEKEIQRLINKGKPQFQDDLIKWESSMRNKTVLYGQPIGCNCRRLYLNSFHKISKYLNDSRSNLYEATVNAIEELSPDQTSSKKHILQSSISYAKFMINQKNIDEITLEKLKTIKIKRFKEPFRPTRTKEDIEKLLEVNEALQTTKASKNLNKIIILFAFFSGLRISEIINLKLEDLK